MKDKLLRLFMCGTMFIGFGLQAQHVRQFTKEPIDVSGKSAIRFNMDKTTPEQRAAADNAYHETLLKQDPNYDRKRNEYEQMIEDHIARNPELRNQASPIVVPVVIHIVWNSGNAAGNISDAQATSQITVLNQDYGRTNPDANNTPTVWKPRSVNMGIQFCLAQRTPTGTATTGIERKQNNTTTSWTTDNAVKAASTGGLDAWDPTKYLNIWVCDLGGGLLGYGEFPTGSPSNTMGVVILNSAFGNQGTVNSPYQLGRTTTHEFSHCFNLFHIWGDDGTACTGTDYCADTPNQAGSTTTCPAFPLIDGCSGTTGANAGDPTNGIMFMNYMDYSYDNCMNMFTANQQARSLAVLQTAPYNALATSNGCAPLVSSNNDAGISGITSPSGTICTASFVPALVLKNFGGNALTSATVKYKVDAGAVLSYSYTGNLASNATANITLPSITSTNGAHIFKAWTTLPNGVADTQTSNDTMSVPFTIAGGAGVALPFSEGFEGTTFVPSGWTLTNVDNDTTWKRTTKAFKTGAACASMNNFSYNTGTGKKDEITTPGLNLSSSPGPVLTFQVAYTYYNQTTPSAVVYGDTLQVLISTNCGTTWTSLYKKGGTALSTATPVNDAKTSFVPTASQWRLESLSLGTYASSSNAMIKFRNISDNGDDLFIDDINISSITGIKDLQMSSALTLYPNPTNGMLSVQLNMPVSGNFQVRVFDVMGRTITTLAESNSLGGTYNVDLSQNANGVYFVEVITDGSSVTRKVILDKK
jgi:hypothetical protein